MWLTNFKATSDADSCGGKEEDLNIQHPEFFDCI